MKDRLPTKENLANRGIIPVDSRMCCAGCEHAEDLKHLFLICPYHGLLWSLVRAWLGVEGVESQVISDYFSQFIHYAGGLKSRRSFFHLIWLLCVWIIWNDRNDRLFRNKQSSLPQLLDKVKSYSLWWLKASNVVFSFGIHSWWSNLFLCMGIDWMLCMIDLAVFFPWLFRHTLCCDNFCVSVNIIHICFFKKKKLFYVQIVSILCLLLYLTFIYSYYVQKIVKNISKLYPSRTKKIVRMKTSHFIF